jgi:C1A family cysteine protease
MYYLTNHGPLSVAIDSTTWKLYKRGVYTDCPTTLKYSHAVVLVGIERDGTWIIRNSWGRGWGDDGYIRLASGNSCGLTDYVFLPLVA